ncbi:hypothetical protein MKW98_026850 [Papaver atlanticum]|uniref:Defensin-like protein n=1 Tax=Papaver atlanticum TaxID=357466 RepID=A0AAD4S032_9MAGN|nr:hypothetical protein MKW98_026850 [Papaver atlanticum]
MFCFYLRILFINAVYFLTMFARVPDLKESKEYNGACHTRNSKNTCFCYFNTCSALRLFEIMSLGLAKLGRPCRNTHNCDKQCRKWEDAAYGACHTSGGKKMCFCCFGRKC